MTTHGQDFTVDDLELLSQLVIDTWRLGADRDWSQPAGTLEWSCRQTARHVVDTTFAPAFFLASPRQDAYPPFEPVRMTPNTTVDDLVDGLRTATNVVTAVIRTAHPDTRSVIRRWPSVETAPPCDFAPRAALEMIVHNHDISSGLGIDFAPPQDLCHRLFTHTERWPQEPIVPTGDHWADLLGSRGR